MEDHQSELNMTSGNDVASEMSGTPSAFHNILDNSGHGAKNPLLGIPSKDHALDREKIIYNSRTILGDNGREMYETWYKMAVFIESGLDLSPIITHRLPIDDFQQGFDVMESGQAGKVVLDWET